MANAKVLDIAKRMILLLDMDIAMHVIACQKISQAKQHLINSDTDARVAS